MQWAVLHRAHRSFQKGFLYCCLFICSTGDTGNAPPVDRINSNEDDDSDENDSNNTASSSDGNVLDSTFSSSDRTQQRLSELQKLKDNCKSEDLEKLKTKCEFLVRDCIASLIVQLSDTDFKSMEGNQSVILKEIVIFSHSQSFLAYVSLQMNWIVPYAGIWHATVIGKMDPLSKDHSHGV